MKFTSGQLDNLINHMKCSSCDKKLTWEVFGPEDVRIIGQCWECDLDVMYEFFPKMWEFME